MDRLYVEAKLRELVLTRGAFKATELALGMPKNCLSNYASGKKILPEKWVKPLSDYLENMNKKRVVLIEDKDGKFLFMEPDGSTRRCTLVWENEYKTEQGAPIVVKIKTVKDQEVPEKYKEPTKYNFGDDKYLNIEKYTIHRLQDKPKNKFEAATWLKEKAAADQEIKLAWEQHKKSRSLN